MPRGRPQFVLPARRPALLRAAALGLAALLSAGAAPPQTAARPDLDVVVSTTLHVTPAHTQAYLEAMRDLARKCLVGLVADPPADPAAPPKDGAAPYRLFIDHKGTVEVGEASAASRAKDPAYADLQHLQTKEEGTFRYRLAEWSGHDYPTVDQWTSQFSTSHFLVIPPKATPEDMVEYRNIALMMAMPEAVARGLLDRLLPIRVSDIVGEAGAPKTLTLTVENHSRWTLRSLGVRITWVEQVGKERYRYQALVRQTVPLPPGKQVVLKGMGVLSPPEFDWQYGLPLKIETEPVFRPQPPGAKAAGG